MRVTYNPPESPGLVLITAVVSLLAGISVYAVTGETIGAVTTVIAVFGGFVIMDRVINGV